jgi:thymidylate synthase
MIAQEVGLEVGKFHHSIVDAHIYCGKGERADWWEKSLDEIQDSISPSFKMMDEVKNIPVDDPDNYDHVPGLLKQINRDPYELPEIEIADKPFDDLGYDDIQLKEYDHHDGLNFGVAE